MLTKLLRYEGRATARVLLPVGGGVILFTLVVGVMNRILNGQSEWPEPVVWIQALMNFAGALALIFVVGICVFIQVQRFYKLLGEQGYLMLSLPVPVWMHIAVKLFCAIVWSLASIVYLIVCGNLLAGNVLFQADSLTLPTLGPSEWAMLFLIFCCVVVAVASAYLSFYLCCAVGGQFGQQRLLASIVSYFVLTFVEQVLTSLAMIVVAFSAIQANGLWWFNILFSMDSEWAAVCLAVVIIIALLVLAAIKWAIIQWLMTRRLNLI